jgi:hypothetical protein
MPCDLCKTLPQNIRSNKQHERLNQVGLTERISKTGKTRAAWVTYYVCEICETEWRHVDDPANPNAGWSIDTDDVVPARLDNQPQTHLANRHT